MDTLENSLGVPVISHFDREAAGERTVIVYALRMPLMSLWTGVWIVRDTEGTTETHTDPFPTPPWQRSTPRAGSWQRWRSGTATC